MGSILLSMLKNIKSNSLNKNFVGYCIEDMLETIGRSDAEAYAKATLDDNILYQGDTAFVQPFYPAKVIVPLIRKVCTHKDLRLNLLKMVHGEQEVIWYKPIKVGDCLKAKLSIASILETPAGELLNFVGQLSCADDLVLETRVSFLVRGKTTKVKKEGVEIKELKEIFRLDLQTNEGQQLDYAKASGDNNFIHTSNFLAKLAGFPRTIMQGLCVMAMSCAALSEKIIANDISRLVSMKGRFANVVLPGQLLEIIGYEGNEPSEIFFEIINPSGQLVLKNGVFKFKNT